jgi:thiamine-phosphate pyrophosphorylase
MKSKKILLKRSRLYLILDRPKFSRLTLKKIHDLVSAGKIGIIQLRDKVSPKAEVLKFAVKLSRRLSRTDTLFIVNNYADIARDAGADGVHLGQGDLCLKRARKILGKGKLIGISCHNLAQAQIAQRDGADYVGIGPVYATKTKPNAPAIGKRQLGRLKSKIKIPYFAIGNINLDNLNQITRQAGAKRIAVCSAILAADNPKAAAKRLYKKLKLS